MALYKIAGSKDSHMRTVVGTWKQMVAEEGQDVIFVSIEGTRVPCSRNIVTFYSKMLAAIVKGTSIGLETIISLPIPDTLINHLLNILINGEASIANKRDIVQVKAAAKLIGISLDDLNIGVDNKITNINANSNTVNVKKEIIDDQIFPSFSGAEIEKNKKQLKVQRRNSVGRPKKAAVTPTQNLKKSRRTSSIIKTTKDVPAEMLLVEMNVLDKVSVKQEPQSDSTMFAFSNEFTKFMKKSGSENKFNQSGAGNSEILNKVEKTKTDQAKSAKNTPSRQNKRNEMPITTPVIKEQKPTMKEKPKMKEIKEIKPTKVSLEPKTLKELKNDLESQFKPVDITDTKGNLVNSAKKLSAEPKRMKTLAKSSSVKAKLIEKPSNKGTVGKRTLVTKSMQRKIIQHVANAKKGKYVTKGKSISDAILKKKELNGTKKHKCGDCDLRFVGVQSLEKHRQVKHPVVKTERVDADVLMDDVAIEYEETEETQCPYCFKQFSQFKRLSAHMKIHKDEV